MTKRASEPVASTDQVDPTYSIDDATPNASTCRNTLTQLNDDLSTQSHHGLPTLSHSLTTTVSHASSCSSSSTDSDNLILTPTSTMGDATSAITHGALRRVFGGEELTDVVVQVVQIKPMTGQSGIERYRVVFNDTINFIQAMVGQQLNHLVSEGTLKRGNLVLLKNFQSNTVKDKPILVVLDMEVLSQYGELEKLGQPKALETIKADEQQEDVKPQAQAGGITGTNFYGNRQQQQLQQPQQAQRQQGLASRTNGTQTSGNITPIEAVSPYAHKWTIKARCSHKGDIKHWHNKNGEGKLFSCNFLDESGEIRATGFNDAVDQWYELLQEGGVYYVSTCRVGLAKKQFSNVNNDYELTFEKDTMIEKAEDNEGVPQVRYNFTTISDLQSVEKDTTIDVIGVLQDVGEVSEIVSKTTSKPYSKRELTLVDNTGFNVRLTIWGNSAQNFSATPECVCAFKGVKVSDFGGRSLSLLSSGSMTIDPDIDEAYKLKGWYDGAGRSEQFQSHANTMSAAAATSGGKNATKTIAQVRDENLGMGDETDWFSTKATIIYVKQENVAYPACLSDGCNKKVIETNPGEWRCEKCNATFDHPDYRYIMSLNVSDHTGQIWLSCFNEAGEMIMGVKANELMQWKEEGEERKVTEAFANANCQTFVFKCKARMDTFQDQQRYVANALPFLGSPWSIFFLFRSFPLTLLAR